MAAVNENDLMKVLRAGEYAKLYYFFGRDIHSVEDTAKRLASKLVPEKERTYNLHRFDGKNLDLSEFSDCVEALPMFSERVCVLVNDLNAEAFSAADTKFLGEILENIPETTTVIIYITGFDVTEGRKLPTGKNKKLIDQIAKIGTVCEFSYKKPSELVRPVIEHFKRLECEISRQNAEYLATLCLSNTVLLHNEIEKLAAYASGNEITQEIIDTLVSRQLDSSSFALAKAIASSDASAAMALLDELFSQRTEPVAILSAVSMSFLDLYRAGTAIHAHKQPADVTQDFGYKASRSFAVTNAFRDVRKFSTAHLRTCLLILAQTDFALKSSKTDGRILIEKAILKMMLKS